MKLLRLFLLVTIVFMGSGLLWIALQHPSTKSLDPTLAPAFQAMGRYSQSLDRLITKVVPVNAMDEKELGEVMISNFLIGYNFYSDADPNVIYLNRIFQEVKQFAKRPFPYKIYLSQVHVPNAFALPGGSIVVHQGLISAMKSESELIAILAHELAHIELEHCFAAVKFELLSRKLTRTALGRAADIANNLLIKHNFQKTQENEADEYAYQLVRNTSYDPRSLGEAFRSLKEALGSGFQDRDRIDYLRDYLLSHPPLELRAQKFLEQAKAWWSIASDETQRYRGHRNLRDLIPFSEKAYEEEWVRR